MSNARKLRRALWRRAFISRGGEEVPNGTKLSDGGEKGNQQRRTLPRRSLERVVRRVELGVWGTEDRRPTGGGMMGAAAGEARTKLATRPDGNRDDGANGNRRCHRSARGQTCPLSTEQRGKAPNDPSSATAGRKANQKGPTPPRRSLERLVRRVTAECSTPQEHASHRRGNDGRCRRERLTEADDEPKGEPRRRSEREQTRLPSQSREEERLTDSSSATEAGEKGRGLQAKADRQPPFAGARC